MKAVIGLGLILLGGTTMYLIFTGKLGANSSNPPLTSQPTGGGGGYPATRSYL